MTRENSIARKINGHFVWKQFCAYLSMNLLVVLMILGVYICQTDIDKTGEIRWNNYRRIRVQTEYEQEPFFKQIRHLDYIVTPWKEEKPAYQMDLGEAPAILALCMVILWLCECIQLAENARTGAKEVRRRLLPLNEMAAKAQVLSDIALDESKYQNLEEAIESLKVDRPDAKIRMHDKELEGIERALNDLLDRMRLSYKQQTQFVSDASHELRTPIAVIQGYVNMLDRWGKDDEQILEESIEAIKNEANHMQKLVEQLLFLARGDSGRQNLDMKEHRLNDIMKEVYEESLMIDEKHIYRFVENASVFVVGDCDMLKQSARILVDNAAKYTQEGNAITIRVGLWEDNNPFFAIQDEGIGMNESDVVHVFDRFYRADAVRNSKTGGTGLGLTIAKWIIDRHNGYVDVVSREGLGTRFSVIFRKES